MLTFERLTILQEELPEVARAAVGPDSPTERRLLLARASIPMDPPDMLATVAFLISDEAEIVSSAAKSTLIGMPEQLLAEALRLSTLASVLDVVARSITSEMYDLLEVVAHNRATSDETVAYIGSRGEGNVLDIISKNQLRLKRHPKIVEAVYFNPNARMGLVLNLLEDAVRLDLDMSAIPGYDEIVESIRGAKDKGKARVVVEVPESEEEEATPPGGPPEPVDEAPAETEQQPESWLEGVNPEEEGGIDDDTFSAVLSQSLSDNSDDTDGPLGRNLLAEIPKMSVPQKVRLALLGNESARRALIRDSKRVVYMSVMKSPRLTEKEIVDFAKNKALNEEVIRMIATNREWTHNYAIKTALVEHPKCPAALAVGFLRMMQNKDIKSISRSHDVPGYVARAAKQILDAIEAGKRKG